MDLAIAFAYAKKAGLDVSDCKDPKGLAKELQQARQTAKGLASMIGDMGGENGGGDVPMLVVGLYSKARFQQQKILKSAQDTLKAVEKAIEAQIKAEKVSNPAKSKASSDLQKCFREEEAFISIQMKLPPPEKFSKELKKLIKEHEETKNSKPVKSKKSFDEDKPGHSFIEHVKEMHAAVPELKIDRLMKHDGRLKLVDKLVQEYGHAQPKLKIYQEFLRTGDPNSPERKKVDEVAAKIDKMANGADNLKASLQVVDRELKSVKGTGSREKKVVEFLSDSLEHVKSVLQPICDCRVPETRPDKGSVAKNVEAAVSKYNSKSRIVT